MNQINMLYIITGCVILWNTLHHTGATFGQSCANDAGCSTPSETCSGSNCACSTGYSHDGNGVCVGVDCGTPTDPTNGGITVTGTTYQNTGTVTCDSGYTLSGSSPITCSSTGSWTTIPTCKSNGVSLTEFRYCYILIVSLVLCQIRSILQFD